MVTTAIALCRPPFCVGGIGASPLCHVTPPCALPRASGPALPCPALPCGALPHAPPAPAALTSSQTSAQRKTAWAALRSTRVGSGCGGGSGGYGSASVCSRADPPHHRPCLPAPHCLVPSPQSPGLDAPTPPSSESRWAGAHMHKAEA